MARNKLLGNRGRGSVAVARGRQCAWLLVGLLLALAASAMPAAALDYSVTLEVPNPTQPPSSDETPYVGAGASCSDEPGRASTYVNTNGVLTVSGSPAESLCPADLPSCDFDYDSRSGDDPSDDPPPSDEPPPSEP